MAASSSKFGIAHLIQNFDLQNESKEGAMMMIIIAQISAKKSPGRTSTHLANFGFKGEALKQIEEYIKKISKQRIEQTERDVGGPSFG